MNFKLIFSVESDEIQQRLRKRTCILNFLKYGGLLTIILLKGSFYILLSGFNEYAADMITTMVVTNIITAVLAFSIYRIRKYSKFLVQNKIFANECLMVCHLLSFFVYTMVQNIITSVYVSFGEMVNDPTEI